MTTASTARPKFHRRHLLIRIALACVAATLTLLSTALPATAETYTATAHLMWLQCNDEHEAFSDEIRVKRPPNPFPIGSWNNVDGGDRLWFPEWAQRQHFSSQLVLNLLEDDSGSLEYLGAFTIEESWAGTGEHELFVRGGDYEYVLHFFVTPTLD